MTTNTRVALPFPADVTGPDSIGTLMKVRPYLGTDGVLRVFAANGREVEEVASAAIVATEMVNNRPRAWSLTDDAGNEWRIVAAGGCGCGSPLRKMSLAQLEGVA